MENNLEFKILGKEGDMYIFFFCHKNTCKEHGNRCNYLYYHHQNKIVTSSISLEAKKELVF